MKSIDLVSGTLAKIKHLENELIALKNEYLAKQDPLIKEKIEEKKRFFVYYKSHSKLLENLFA